jgi:hypothetical protein
MVKTFETNGAYTERTTTYSWIGNKSHDRKDIIEERGCNSTSEDI